MNSRGSRYNMSPFEFLSQLTPAGRVSNSSLLRDELLTCSLEQESKEGTSV